MDSSLFAPQKAIVAAAPAGFSAALFAPANTPD